jgi:WD40 repeat protein
MLSILLGATIYFGANPAPKLTYDQNVMPLLRDKCFNCHNQDRKSGGLRLNTFTNLMTGGASGAAVKAGDPEGSMLYKLVTHQQEPHMPPKSPMLPKESLDLIKAWISGGALENTGSKAVVINKPKVDIALTSIIKGKPGGPPPMPQKLNLEPVVKTGRANAMTALASSPWAPLVAVAGQKQVLLYHSDSLELLGVLPFPEGVPYVLKFSRNGSLLLAGGGRGGKSGRVVVWSVNTGERIFEVGDEMDAVLGADISADQTQIALGGPSKVIRIFSTRDGKLLHEIKKHTDWIYSIEYSPDGVLLATGDRNGGLFVWESHTGREYFSLRGHTAAITDLSWRTDSNVLASASEDTTIRLWEMENGGQIKGWGAHGGGVESVKYARDGRLVSCGRDQVARMWDQNGAQQRVFEAFPDVALRVAFSHDAARVIAGDWTGQLRVWNGADGKYVGSLVANPLSVADRLAQAIKEVTTRQAAYNQLAAAATASQAAAQKAGTDLAAAQRAVADTAAAAKTMAAAQLKAKEVADKAAAAVPPATARSAARQAAVKLANEAEAKAKIAADQAPTNKDLAAALAKSKEAVAKAAAELAAAQKAEADLAAVAKMAAEALRKAQTAATVALTAAAAAPKTVGAQTAVNKTAAAKAAADKAAADQAAAFLAAGQGLVERLKIATVNKQASK